MKKVLRIAAGIGLVLLGILGGLLPIVPGFVFMIPGLMILAEYFPPVQRLVEWAKAKAEKATGRKFEWPPARGGAPADESASSAKMEETP